MPTSIVCACRNKVGTNGSSPASCCKRSKVDNACLKSNVFSIVGCQNPTYSDGATICSCSRSILLLTDDKCDLHLHHPIVDQTSSSRLFFNHSDMEFMIS